MFPASDPTIAISAVKYACTGMCGALHGDADDQRIGRGRQRNSYRIDHRQDEDSPRSVGGQRGGDFLQQGFMGQIMSAKDLRNL